VIAVFTKFDQFRRDVGMKLEDLGLDTDDPSFLYAEMERIFKEEFLANLKGSPPFVRLESEDFIPASIYYANCCPVEMHRNGQKCTDLIETTANALSGGAIALMLLAVQKGGLEKNINQAVEWQAPTNNGTKRRVASDYPVTGPSPSLREENRTQKE
jgi:hypothetical protein